MGLRQVKLREEPVREREERTRSEASPWKLGGVGPITLARRVYGQVDQDEVLTRSAALSYYFVFALFPMLFFLITMMGFLAQSGNLQNNLFSYAERVLPPDAFSLLQKTLKEIAKQASGLKLAFGLMLALWSASGGVSSIMDALNRCYHVKDSRSYIKQKVISLWLTIAISALVIIALVVILYGGDIANFVGSHTGLSGVTIRIWQVAQWVLAFFLVVLSFALLYYWGPDVEQQWRWITPGSLVGVIAWIVASVGFRIYLHFFNSFSKTYGSVGAVIVLLLWLYISGLAILFGGEINSEIEHAAAEHGHPEAKPEGRKAA